MQILIPLILENLPSILKVGKAGYDFIQSVRSAAQQSGEWTDAQEAEFQAKLADESIDPAWLPDAPAPAPALPKAKTLIL